MAIVTLVGYCLYTLQMISPAYKTKPSSVRLAYQTCMALKHVLAMFLAKISEHRTVKYRLLLQAHTQHITKMVASPQRHVLYHDCFKDFYADAVFKESS